MLLKAYYKRPDATAESINAEGYFMTGDAGFFDEDGHLKIIDRAKDVGKLANGAMFAPNYIENKLKFFQHIKEAVCFGNGRDEVCAFINIDLGSGRQLGRAPRHRLLGLHRPGCRSRRCTT
jgi:long-chain acyl-CoA synthetase